MDGKTVLVTGSSGGLGQVIAQAFLSKGANVVLCDINAPRLDATSTSLESTHPGKVFAKQVDVGNEDSVKALVSAAVEKFGRLDVVVNNAGIMDLMDPAGTCDIALWDRVMSVNSTGPFLVTKHVVQVMEKQKKGVIVNIGSNASSHGFSAGVAYTASKHAVAGITKNTAAFYGPRGISTFAIMLGSMETTNISDGFAAGFNPDGIALMHSLQPNYKPGETGMVTDDVAQFIVFLSQGDMAVNVNGSCLVFNKGWPLS